MIISILLKSEQKRISWVFSFGNMYKLTAASEFVLPVGVQG